MSVGLHLLAVPQSTGLFAAAMMESNPLALAYKDPVAADMIGSAFASLVGCADGALDCLRNVPVATIITNETNEQLVQFILLDGFEDLLIWAPIIDGTVITGEPFSAAREHGFPKPTLLGTNRDEGTLFVYGILDELGQQTLSKFQYEAVITTRFGCVWSLVHRGGSPRCGDLAAEGARVRTG